MQLSTLPREILDYIFVALLLVVSPCAGPRKILYLRTVNKLFNLTILHTLTISSLQPPNSVFHIWLSKSIIPISKKYWLNQFHRRISPPILRHFIAAQIQSLVSSPAISHLRTVLKSLDSLAPVSNTQERQNRALKICEGAAEYLEYSSEDGHELVLAWRDTRNPPFLPQRLSPNKEEAQSLLSMAIIAGNNLLVQRLLQNKNTDLNLNYESSYFGLPLQIAAYWNHIEILELILSHGADPLTSQFHQASWNPVDWLTNEKTRGIYYSTHGTALEVASLRGHVQVVHLLLQPPRKLPTSQALPSLHATARGGHVEVLRVLLEAYPDLENREVRLGDLFLQGCRWGRLEIAEMMLAMGVSKGEWRKRAGRGRAWSGIGFATKRGDERILRLFTDAEKELLKLHLY